MVSGFGTDHGDRPVPTVYGDPFTPAPDIANNRSGWKSGPVDLKWDYVRGVWSMGHHMIAGVVIGSIDAPTSPCQPTYFKMKVFRNIVYDTPVQLEWKLGESAIITNRDPSLQQDKAGDLIWIVAARINYEWIPVWVGCPDACQTEEEKAGSEEDPNIPACNSAPCATSDRQAISPAPDNTASEPSCNRILDPTPLGGESFTCVDNNRRIIPCGDNFCCTTPTGPSIADPTNPDETIEGGSCDYSEETNIDGGFDPGND